MIANLVTLSRIPFSLLLLILEPDSALFAVFYLLCGLSDVLDGFLARRLHTQSEAGARLDSAADLVFAVVYAVRLLPRLSVPVGIRLWIAAIAVAKLALILAGSLRTRRFTIPHSPANKLTGLLIFLLPLSVRFLDKTIGAAIVCAVATYATADELRIKPRISRNILEILEEKNL